jgi:hypothetical protein
MSVTFVLVVVVAALVDFILGCGSVQTAVQYSSNYAIVLLL